MTNINDAELMKKILIFSRKAHAGRFPGSRKHSAPCLAPEGYRGPTDGCFHPGRHPGHPHEEERGSRPAGFMHPVRGAGRPALAREHILVILGKHPEGMRQKVIAEKMGINQSSTSELVDKLENDGYIIRKIDPGDKRATLLFLTEKGEARAAEVEDERTESIRELFAVLTDEEKQTLSDLLDKLLSGQKE